MGHVRLGTPPRTRKWVRVVERVGAADAGYGDLVGRTTSCAHTWERTRDETHCGNCSQSLDR
jgi:hypothetical protein